MALKGLDHVTVNCADLDRSRDFYSRALGLVDGDRPPFPFPGAWLYLDSRPVVHLVGGSDRTGPTGSFDHVAFEASDFEAVRQRLKGAEIPFAENVVPGFRIRQIFLDDPDGVRIELNFRD